MHITIEGELFTVELNNQTFKVIFTEDYYKKLHLPNSKEEIVRASFRFLLDNEPQESILPEFNLKLIETYFPKFTQQLQNYLSH